MENRHGRIKLSGGGEGSYKYRKMKERTNVWSPAEAQFVYD